jgi:hypothetical protein
MRHSGKEGASRIGHPAIQIPLAAGAPLPPFMEAGSRFLPPEICSGGANVTPSDGGPSTLLTALVPRCSAQCGRQLRNKEGDSSPHVPDSHKCLQEGEDDGKHKQGSVGELISIDRIQ